MLNKFLIIIVFLSSQFLFLNTVHSDVYKWTDENGKAVYEDKPNSNNAVKMEIKTPPKKDKAYQERYKKQEKLLNVMQEEREEKIALKKEEKKKKNEEKEKCDEVIKNFNKIKDVGFLYENTDDPFNPKIISGEQRKEQEEGYEAYIKENC